jgi:hypothetical protein
MKRLPIVLVVLAVSELFWARATFAQTAPESRWNVEFGIGWDNSISGNINSSAFGQLNNQPVVITKNTYEDVYGTGLHMRFGGGYMLDENSEVRAIFTLQSLDADLTAMGEIGAANLYGQYSDYQAFTLDAVYRRYAGLSESVRGYGEGTIGFGFVDKTDVILLAPAANFSRDATDFYDQTAAFTVGINAGLMFDVGRELDFFGQIGFRYVTGMSEVDALTGTGLETINDKSARWTFPLVVGIRKRF